MNIRILNQPDELHSCIPFQVDCLLWGTTYAPRTYGRIGFVEQDGFYLEMICEEENPRRIYTLPNSPVYIDSAMEAFFQFAPGGILSEKYLNFEMNANGALLAMYGASRSERTPLSDEQHRACHCQAQIREDRWQISLRLPLTVLKELYGEQLLLGRGSQLACNFYKLSENTDILHFASCAPILSDTPNFHLPQFFEPAVLTLPEDEL